MPFSSKIVTVKLSIMMVNAWSVLVSTIYQNQIIDACLLTRTVRIMIGIQEHALNATLDMPFREGIVLLK